MKLQASEASNLKNLQSQNARSAENRVWLSALAVIHGRLSRLCLFESAQAIVSACCPPVHGLDFAQHVSEQRLVALARVIEPHNDRGEDAHVIAQAGDISDKPLILASKKVQISFGHSCRYNRATTV